MAQQTETIFGRNATLFRDGPQPIYLLHDGKFAVQYGGKWKSFASLAKAEAKGKQKLPSIKLFSCNASQISHSQSIEVVDAAEWTEGGKIFDPDGKRHFARYSDWFVFDAEVVAALKAWEKERAAVEKKLNLELARLTKNLKRVSRHNLKDMIEGNQEEA